MKKAIYPYSRKAITQQMKRKKRTETKITEKATKTGRPDFSNNSIYDLCEGMNLIIRELADRGINIGDFEDKQRRLYQIQSFGERVYFLATKEGID